MASRRSERIGIRLRPHEVEAVDAAARAAGVNRSDLVRCGTLRLTREVLVQAESGTVPRAIKLDLGG